MLFALYSVFALLNSFMFQKATTDKKTVYFQHSMITTWHRSALRCMISWDPASSLYKITAIIARLSVVFSVSVEAA